MAVTPRAASVSLALLLAVLSASAQNVGVAPVPGSAVPRVPVSRAAGWSPATGAPAASLSVAAPSLGGSFAFPSAAAPSGAAAASAASASAGVLAAQAVPASVAVPAGLAAAPAVAVSVSPSAAPVAAHSPSAVRSPDQRSAAAVAVIEGGVASWGSHRPEAFSAVAAPADSEGPAPLAKPTASAPADRPAPPSEPVPPAQSHARPALAKAAMLTGMALTAVAAAAFFAPALLPAAVAAWKGAALWTGMALLNVGRFFAVPKSAAGVPQPAPSGESWGAALKNGFVGLFKSSWERMKSLWAAARGAADTESSLEDKVGGGSLKSYRDWLLGGLRAAALWMPLTIATMAAGWGLAKPVAHFFTGTGEGMLTFDAVATGSLWTHLFGFVAASLAAEAVVLAVFDGMTALSRRLGAGKWSTLIGGLVAMAASAGLVMLVTTTPSVVGTTLGIEAGLLWLRTRSGSWLAPLAQRAIFSLLSLEAARLAVRIALGTAAGTLIGLPAVWTGAAVTGMLAAGLAVSAKSLRPAALWAALKSQTARVAQFGAAWRTPKPNGAPHSPWPLVKLAALWGMVLYAIGDLSYWAVHAVAGGTEPTPAILGQMLTAPVDLVIYNFLLVGFLEEFVFRFGLFKKIFDRLSKWKLKNGKLFWTAAVLSGLLFSYAHYINPASVMSHLGMGDAAATSGLAGSYAFTWAGFAARAILGVALAWLYTASGTLLLPILAHFAADSYEGLGLRWGMVPFLAMAAGALLIQWIGRRRAAPPPPPAP